MSKRGANAFKRNDVIRAIESARAAGLEPTGMEVVLGPDGSITYRVLGNKVDTAQDGTKVWNEEIARLKSKGGKGQ